MEVRSASFIRRAGAGLVDLALFVVFILGAAAAVRYLSVSWSILLSQLLILASVLVAVCNGIVLPAVCGQTLGCRLLRVKIANTDRQTIKGIGWLPAISRFFAQVGVSPVAFFLGYAWHFIDARNRMWHDHLSATICLPLAADYPQPFSRVNHLRSFAALALGIISLAVILTPVWLWLALNFTQQSAAREKIIEAVPADFPSSITIPSEDKIDSLRVVDHPKINSREVQIQWQGLEADPVSVLLAYKTGLEMVGFSTDIEYRSIGPTLFFSDASGTTIGTVEVFGIPEEKYIERVFLTVFYPADNQ